MNMLNKGTYIANSIASKTIKQHLVLFGVVMLGWLCSVAVIAAVEEHKIEDKSITQVVEAKLVLDKIVAGHLLDVETKEGIVTLSGVVNSLFDKERAVELTQMVKGVRSVIDRINVNPEQRSDDEIRKDVKSSLFADPAADSYEIGVEVTNGEVTLTGTVNSWAEKNLSRLVVRDIPGVNKIIDKLEVRYRERPDPEIEADIKGLLATDVRINDNLIEVECNEGNVSLSGVVGSFYERVRAHHKSRVAGVKSVDSNSLDIQWWMRDKTQRYGKGSDLTNQKIAEAIRLAFTQDPRIFSLNPDISVHKGVITLSGTVNNLKAKRAAEETALNTIGVRRVKNILKVRPEKLEADDVILERVEKALEQDPFVDGEKITTKVHNSRVRLYGTVESHFVRARAGMAASGAAGVIDVDNHVDIREVTDWTDDEAIVEDIESEFFWSPFVDGDEVKVVVKEGVAYLTGTADSHFERRMATQNALDAGAKRVVNETTVDSNLFVFW